MADEYGTYSKDGLTIVAETPGHAVDLRAAGFRPVEAKATADEPKVEEPKANKPDAKPEKQAK